MKLVNVPGRAAVVLPRLEVELRSLPWSMMSAAYCSNAPVSCGFAPHLVIVVQGRHTIRNSGTTIALNFNATLRLLQILRSVKSPPHSLIYSAAMKRESTIHHQRSEAVNDLTLSLSDDSIVSCIRERFLGYHLYGHQPRHYKPAQVRSKQRRLCSSLVHQRAPQHIR